MDIAENNHTMEKGLNSTPEMKKNNNALIEPTKKSILTDKEKEAILASRRMNASSGAQIMSKFAPRPYSASSVSSMEKKNGRPSSSNLDFEVCDKVSLSGVVKNSQSNQNSPRKVISNGVSPSPPILSTASLIDQTCRTVCNINASAELGFVDTTSALQP